MGRAWEKSIRYAFDTPESWDIARLTALTQALPAGFTLHPMDGALYARCRETAQLRDLCGCDGDEAAFFAHGLGVVALHGQELAGGASAYAWDDAGIEVEIETLPPFCAAWRRIAAYTGTQPIPSARVWLSGWAFCPEANMR